MLSEGCLRRTAGDAPAQENVVWADNGRLEIDLERRIVRRDGDIVSLSRTEWLLLQHLAANSVALVTPNPANGQSAEAFAPALGYQTIAGDIAYNICASGTATRASDAVARDRRTDVFHHPITIVRADSGTRSRSTRGSRRGGMTLLMIRCRI